MVKRDELVKFLDNLLNVKTFSDYGPNGLQIEGKEEVKKIAFAVSATRESIEKACEKKADAMIVHHGLFWSFHGPRTITNAFGKRVTPLIKNDINLLGYHLPLDAHIEYGNAAAIAKKLEMENFEPFGDRKGSPLGVKARFKQPLGPAQLKSKLEAILGHSVIHSCPSEEKIESMGIITGGANSDWLSAQADGLDAYLTGEISEHDWHEAKEGNVHFFAGGHNATEQFGVQEIMNLLESKHPELECFYIPSDNPA
ncbi:MAG: Nif3-like dinuclear metal center hexameric protein [Halobacteriovoraceae bacterium]|nr:Nif3-like dinuclear metal center hexameric protein [Halobacteriovoraceae bacterium]|tara:strand:- start:63039 stop:63803 length:765 start_codon:yes stop_codon:yes gene_type:complete